MNHTPGPWHVNNGDVYSDANVWIPIAEISHIGVLSDAQLMAAAPDLLATLEAVEWVEKPHGYGCWCPWCLGTNPDHTPDCPRQLALAKARGE